MRKLLGLILSLALASPAFGNAVSSATRIQGVPLGQGFPVQVRNVDATGAAVDPGGGVAQGSTTATQTGPLVQCAVTTAAPTYTTAQTDPLSCDATGNLRVVTAAGGTAQGASSSGVTGGMVQAVATTAAPTYTTATVNPFSLTTGGLLRTDASGANITVNAHALTAGSAIIGKVGIDQTTPGTTNLVAASQSGTWNIGTVTTLPALVAGSAVIGKVSIDQTTPGTTNLVSIGSNASTNEAQINGVTPLMGNGVTGTGSQRVTVASDNTAIPVAPISGQTGVAGGSGAVTAATIRTVPAAITYKTIAASQTNFALGTGAIGDYLSHCVIQPTTTAAGTVTILDNATVIFTFTTGTLSDLSPRTYAAGAASVSGAWKVTTGTNETVTCFGVFTP